MFRKIVQLVIGVAGASVVGGCSPMVDAKVEEPEACIVQNFNIPGAPPSAGDQTVHGSDSVNVPGVPTGDNHTKVTTNLNLTRACLLSPPDAPVDLSFVKSLRLTVSALAHPLMSYDRPSQPVSEMNLSVSNEDLIDLLTQHRDLAFDYAVTGQIPSQSTTANIRVCFHAKAEVGIQ